MRESNSNLVFTDTWRKVKLGDICKIKSGNGIKKDEYIENGEYSIIGANGEIGRTDKYNNEKPMIVTGRVGTIGAVNLVDKCWITDNTLMIDIESEEVYQKYLYYVLNTIDFKSITTGNAQPLVTAGRLKDVEVYLPSLPEQLQISSILSDYDMLIESERE